MCSMVLVCVLGVVNDGLVPTHNIKEIISWQLIDRPKKAKLNVHIDLTQTHKQNQDP